MTKITAEHLSRSAYVYVRQSTMGQVLHNQESRHRQYGLAERARQLGWQTVVVVDDDLGRSGSGVVRPGFDRLLTAVGRGEVGAVLSVEASRLARNGRDWHTLLEFCGIVGTLIIDEEDVYDPRLVNDQMVLGLKGTFSAMELSTIRQRSDEARRQKAERGELFGFVAVGYVRTADDRLERDPDTRICEALTLVFSKFREFNSARQVMLWLRQEHCLMPVISGAAGRPLEWKLPPYSYVLSLLTNPIYAGAYAYGRTRTETRLEDGRKLVRRGLRRDRADWLVLRRDHHEAYIGWDEFEHNQRVLAANANQRGEAARGAVRSGPVLLAGLLRCGHCGRKMKVSYGGRGGVAGRYDCARAMEEHTTNTRCITFGSLRIDVAVSAEVLRRLDPLGIAAAVAAIESGQDGTRDQRRQAELALEQARYQAGLARRQYDAVDPDNRLVAAELERRWNERLDTVRQLEERLAALDADAGPQFSPSERARLLELGRDLTSAWNHPAASAEIKKRILRTIIHEIVVRVEANHLRVMIHWQGGDHTALEVARNPHGKTRWETDLDTTALITELARVMPDASIAAVLNRIGKRTAKGLTWKEGRVRAIRKDHGVPVYRDGERAERGELVLDEVAMELGVSKMTVIRLIRDKVLPARQVCPRTPYVIRREDLDLPAVRAAGTKRAISADPRQMDMEFQ